MKFTRSVITPGPTQRRALYRKKVLGGGTVGSELGRAWKRQHPVTGKIYRGVRPARPRIRIANSWLETVAGFHPGDRYAVTCPKPGVLVFILTEPPKFEVKPAPESTQIPAWKQQCPVCGVYRSIHNPGKNAHERGAKHLNAIAKAKAEFESAVANATAAVPG